MRPSVFRFLFLCTLLLVHGTAGLSLGEFISSLAGRSSSSSVAGQLHSHVQQQEQHGEITSLPGYSSKQLPSKHYGGYISVGSRQLYYYLAESERSPADDPVV